VASSRFVTFLLLLEQPTEKHRLEQVASLDPRHGVREQQLPVNLVAPLALASLEVEEG